MMPDPSRRQPLFGRFFATCFAAAFAVCVASAMAHPPYTSVDILGPEDGGMLPPANLLIIDVTVSVNELDTWTTGGLRGTVANGASLVYFDDEGGPALVGPGFSNQFVTCFSAPLPRTSSTRFSSISAGILGAYSPAAPSPVATAGAVNVAFYRSPVPLPGQYDGVDGAIARIALDVSAVSVPQGWKPFAAHLTGSAPPTAGIPVFVSQGQSSGTGTVNASQDTPTLSGLDWGVYYAFGGDLDGDGDSDATDAEDFREAWRCRNCPASIAAADADQDGDLDCDDVVLMREAQYRAGREFYLYAMDGNAATGAILDYGPAVAIQNTQTSLGDSLEGDIAASSGSELDAAFAKIDCDSLYVVLAGNLSSNPLLGHRLVLFIDSKEGGQQRLLGDNEGLIHVLNVNLLGDDGSGNGLRFDDDFAPDYMIAVRNTTMGAGSSWIHVDYAEFPTEGGGTMFHVGNSSPGSALFNYGYGENPGLFGALDNSNSGGVGAGTGEAYGDGVTTGLEMGFRLEAIGNPQCGVRLCAMILDGGWPPDVSNQVLHPIGGGDALGPARSVNLATVPRQQLFPGGTSFDESVKLVAPDGAAGDGLRYAAIEGDFAALGAPNHSHAGGPAGAGAVYLWRRIGGEWTFDREIRPDDLQSNDKFGSSVAMHGSFLIVGSPQDDDRGSQAGAAYIFQRNAVSGEWTQRQKITAADGSSGDNFGASVAVVGTRIIVGAPGADGVAPGSGAAYFFELGFSLTFEQQRKMTASDGATGDGFGTSVGMWSDWAVVGAPTDDHAAVDAGSAYVFRRSAQNFGATEHRVLRPPGLPASSLFGRAVALDGSIAACGASGAGAGGQAFVYIRSGLEWNLTQTISAADGTAGDAFGSGIAVGSQLLVVGASGDDVHFNEGSVYLFHFDGLSFSPAAKLNAPDGAAGDNLGGLGGLAIDGATLLVGAGAADPGGNLSQGAGYLFDLAVLPPIPIGEARRWDLSLGQSDGISAGVSSGSPVTAQWRRNGVPLIDGPTPWGTLLSGTSSINLLFTNPHYEDAGDYDCVFINDCGSAVSPMQTVRVLNLGDLNCDGLVSAADCMPMRLAFDDPAAYIGAYPACPIDNADFNADGEVTPDDLTAYCEGPWLALSDCESACSGCAADFDGNGTREVPDIFAFLSAWFAMSPAADFDGNGTIAVPDIFAFLSAWFGGCP